MQLKRINSIILPILCVLGLMINPMISFADKLPHSMRICDIFPDKKLAEIIQKKLLRSSPESHVFQWELNLIRYIETPTEYEHHTDQLNLEGMQYLNNLSLLSIWNANIENLEPLAGMKKLKTIYLIDDHISDISPLASVVNLESLEINHNNINDNSPLSNLHKLTRLIIQDNQISDITPLANMHQLELLAIDGNPVPYPNIESIFSIPALAISFSDSCDPNRPFSKCELITPGQKHSTEI